MRADHFACVLASSVFPAPVWLYRSGFGDVANLPVRAGPVAGAAELLVVLLLGEHGLAVYALGMPAPGDHPRRDRVLIATVSESSLVLSSARCLQRPGDRAPGIPPDCRPKLSPPSILRQMPWR